jgi:serine/threonine protein kinase
MISIGDIIEETWHVTRRAGKGTFCELFSAINIHTNELVAIKTQNRLIEGSVLKWEADVLQSLSSINTVPKYIHHGNVNGQDFLVMELLGGEDMSKLRNRIRAQQGMLWAYDLHVHHSMPNNFDLIVEPGGQYPITVPMAVFFTREILRGLQQLHESGYVHRDVKPSNFIRESKDSHIFRMIDFGVTKQVENNVILFHHHTSVNLPLNAERDVILSLTVSGS